MSRRDPAGGEEVWSVPSGQRARVRPRYLVLALLLLVPMTLTATLGTISFSDADGTAIARFWPAAAFQVVFSIWFGVYGALAGIVGPMLGNGLVGDSAFLYTPAYTVQCCLAGLCFRYLRLDPRLRSRRDWAGAILLGCVLSNALGGLAGVTEGALRGAAWGGAVHGLGFWAGKFLQWFAGNTVPCLVLVPAMLKSASPMIVRDPFFCQRFWGGANISPGRTLWHRLSHLPMMAKLMLLTLVAGILPLSAVAACTLWDLMQTVESLAAETNLQAARGSRNRVERHELLLKWWAGELDRPGLNDRDRKEMLAGWQAMPETFKKLRIADEAGIMAELKASVPPEALARYQEELSGQSSTVFFYVGSGRGYPRGRDVRAGIRLRSAPGKVLTGRCVWRGKQPFTGQWAAVEGFLVVDRDGRSFVREVPAGLADWHPGRQGQTGESYTIRWGGRRWHVAEAPAPGRPWRIVTLTSARAGRATVLADVPYTWAALISLAIFGSLIAGSAIARRISGRVLAIAERIRETGAEPGKLRVPVRGPDELGYLAETLNRMSRDLAENVRRLREATAEKERLAAEMELARQVQMTILPARPPEVLGYELAGASRPAREVGGDFFDFFLDADGRVVMMIGDAVGKGLKAAMFITETHSLAHAAALDRPTPERILRAVNSALVSWRGESSDFVTMLCAVLEPQRHSLLYASAGHDPPILLRNGRARRLEIGSLPLAVSAKNDYQLHRVALAPGDAIVMYTDGVTEAANADGELLGIERLKGVVRARPDGSAAELLDDVLQATRAFAASASQADDVTLLVLRRCE